MNRMKRPSTVFGMNLQRYIFSLGKNYKDFSLDLKLPNASYISAWVSGNLFPDYASIRAFIKNGHGKFIIEQMSDPSLNGCSGGKKMKKFEEVLCYIAAGLVDFGLVFTFYLFFEFGRIVLDWILFVR